MNPKVLIIDDEDDSLDILGSFIGRHFAFDAARSGPEALTAVVAGNPEIILLDVEMPGGMNGYQVCRALKDSEATRHIPVIFISAHTGAQNRLQAYESGADDYVSKPFNATEIKYKFDLALANQAKRNELAEKARKATSVAMLSLREAADSGVVLGFLSDIIRQTDLEAIAATTLATLRKFRLAGAVQMRDGELRLSRNSEGACTPVEDGVLTEMAHQQRIVDLGSRSAFNYRRATIVVYDMPLHDMAFYGQLKDTVVKMAEALDVHLNALEDINAAITCGDTLRDLCAQLQTQRDSYRQALDALAERLDRAAADLPDTQHAALRQLAHDARARAQSALAQGADMEKQLAAVAAISAIPARTAKGSGAAGGGERFNSVELF